MVQIPFSDFGVKWFNDIVAEVISWFRDAIVQGYSDLSAAFFGTQLPTGNGVSVIFSAPDPSDQPWSTIYSAVVAGEVTLLAILIIFIALQGRHFIRIFDFGSVHQSMPSRYSFWTGILLVVTWYWVAVLFLYAIHGFTTALIPDIDAVANAIIQIIPTAVNNPAIALLIAAIGAVAMLLLQALFFIRQILLYVYLFGMPFGIAVAFGNVPVVSRIARRLCVQFIPLAVLPLPAAVLFRGYDLLFVQNTFVTPSSSFLQYLVVVSLPVIALFVTWKTFRYASPLTARVLRTTAGGVATVGAVAGAAYVAGPYAATTAARFGPRAGATHAAATRFAATRNGDQAVQPAVQTRQDYVAVAENGGVPPYRRTENDPGRY